MELYIHNDIYKYQTFVEISKHIIKWNTFNTIYLWTVTGIIRASKDRLKLILPAKIFILLDIYIREYIWTGADT